MFIILPYSANRSKLLICKHCRTLQSAQIIEDRYFHSVIHKDIDRIADDLRILHSESKKDTQIVSDDTGGLSILIELLQKLKDFKGTPQEIKLRLFTLILGTDINRLNKQLAQTRDLAKCHEAIMKFLQELNKKAFTPEIGGSFAYFAKEYGYFEARLLNTDK